MLSGGVQIAKAVHDEALAAESAVAVLTADSGYFFYECLLGAMVGLVKPSL